MSQVNVISIKRKVAIGSGVAVLLLAAVGCSFLFFNHEDAPEDLVKVSNIPDRLPLPSERAALEKSLPKGVTGIILVSEIKNTSEGPIITAITRKGDPINLCGSKSKTECTLATTAGALAQIVSGPTNSEEANTIGSCEVGTVSRSCHKDGNYQNKWAWHRTPDRKNHSDCPSGCQ